MKSRTKSKARACAQPQVQISMPLQGVLQDVQQAFYGLCIEAGRRVLDVMMEADREALCGPKGVPDAQRRAVRGGHTSSRVVLGGQRIDIRRPRARALDSGELPLPTFAWAAGADPLNAATLSAVAAGVSTVGADAVPGGGPGSPSSPAPAAAVGTDGVGWQLRRSRSRC